MTTGDHTIAVWGITPNGARIASSLAEEIPGAVVFLSRRLAIESGCGKAYSFERLKDELERRFHEFSGHIFIMATGIVVRMIGPMIQDKTRDPAVVVVDDAGNHAISLLSGHLGGANELALRVAGIIGANPVITTATDVNRKPAIDMMAKEKKLVIENPRAIKTINMALLSGDKIFFSDPWHLLLPEAHAGIQLETNPHAYVPKVCVDDRICERSPDTLVLRPKSLVAGIGCNRGTSIEEIRDLLLRSLEENNLSALSLGALATIDIKHDEAGIVQLANELKIPLLLFDRSQLETVENIISPSVMVEKHVGVKSVCEAASILAANQGELLIPKQKTKNVTVAIARKNFTSLA